MARQTKADRILNDSAMRLEAARMRVSNAQFELNTARATRDALQEAHNSLERELTPKPRKKAAQSQSAQTTDKKAEAAKAEAPKSNGQLCKAMVPGLGVECAESEENAIHDQSAGYAAYHPFSLIAEKKSRRKSAAANNTQSTETNSEAAISASGD